MASRERYGYTDVLGGGEKYRPQEEVVDRSVASGLLRSGETTGLQRYDLSGFPVEITDPEVAAQLDGLTPRSIRISQNLAHCARLGDFYRSFVEPEQLLYEPSEGVSHRYRNKEVSLAGDDGSLIHIRHVSNEDRLNAAAPLLAVISHLDSTQPAVQLPATRRDVIKDDGRRVPTYVIGSVQDPTLQLVGSKAGKLEWAIEKTVLRSEATTSLAYVELDQHRMSYKRADNHWEMLGDLTNLHRRVGKALSRELQRALEQSLVQHEAHQELSEQLEDFARTGSDR